MIAPGADLKIYMATRPIDFRCGHDGLAAKVQEMLRLDHPRRIATREVRREVREAAARSVSLAAGRRGDRARHPGRGAGESRGCDPGPIAECAGSKTPIAIAAACRPICLGWNGSSSLRARSVRAVAIAIQYVVIVTRHSAVIRLRTKPIKARFNLTLLFKVTGRN